MTDHPQWPGDAITATANRRTHLFLWYDTPEEDDRLCRTCGVASGDTAAQWPCGASLPPQSATFTAPMPWPGDRQSTDRNKTAHLWAAGDGDEQAECAKCGMPAGYAGASWPCGVEPLREIHTVRRVPA